jgi:putative solute:sodium symporter small subunit
MTLGFAVSFVLPYFARSWVGTRWLGWTFSYYMAAQGAILLYVAIVAIYAVSMAALDRHYQARNGPAT